jgi:membrane fusion protein, heavy metal efflux system
MFTQTLEQTRPHSWFAVLIISLTFGTVASNAVAHEGHAPLPSKGVQVDVKKGLLTLSPVAQKSLGVQTAAAEKRTLTSNVLAYATLVTPWQGQHLVSPQISGRIARLHVETGEMVEKNQLLAELSSPELEAVRLQLKNALKEIELSERQLARIRTLVESQAVAGRELLELESKYLQNQNSLEIARAKLKALGFEGEGLQNIESQAEDASPLLLPITSPAPGTVSHTDLAVGKVVAAEEHLFKVTDLSTLWVQIGVLERDISTVKEGQSLELELSAFPKKVIRTNVTIASVYVDPNTSLGTVWAEITNPTSGPKYLPGMYGVVRIFASPTQQVLTVPTSAVLGTGAERYVLVEVASTAKGYEFQRQNVVIGSQNSLHTEIRGGQLYPGDRIVSRGGQVLSSFFVLGVLRLSPEGIRNVGLKVEPVQPRVIQEVVEFDGKVDLRPDDIAKVSSQLPGLLHRLLVGPGEKVQAGQIVAEISGLQLQDMQLEMVRAHLEAELLNSTLRRMESIRDSGALAARRIWETENQRDLAVNRRDSAKRTLNSMGISKEQIDSIIDSRQPVRALPVRAPIDGVVTNLTKTLGEAITEEDSLLEIQNLSRPRIHGFVSESQARRITVGTPARVRLVADPQFVGEGSVIRSAQTLVGENRTLSVWLELIEMPKQTIHPNLLVRISAIVGKHDPQLAVKRSAVLRDGTRAYVFVQKGNGLIERRYVKLGPADDQYAAILTGLAKGERVAVQGVAELQTTYASIR